MQGKIIIRGIMNYVIKWLGKSKFTETCLAKCNISSYTMKQAVTVIYCLVSHFIYRAFMLVGICDVQVINDEK